MKNFAKMALTLAIPFTFAACGSSNNNPVDNIREAGKAPDLQEKIFRGECSLKPLEAIASGIATAGKEAIKSAREQYQFVGANITHATLLYTSADCTGTESLIFKETGEFSIDGEQKSKDGGKFIDIKYNKLTAQAHDDAGVLVANEVKLCGIQDWGNREEREVTGNASEATCYRKAVPNSDKNLYSLEGNTLVFGDKGIFDRNDERPDSLDKDNKYIAE